MKTLLSLVLALTTGCLPFVVPPAKVEIGAGPATGAVKRNGGTIRPKSVTQLRAGVHPLDLVPKASEGPFDVGLGYGGDFIFGRSPGGGRTSAHGPYLEASYFPVRVPTGSDLMLRWGARGNLDLLYLEPKNVVGWGGTVVTEIEIGGHAHGAFANSDGDGAVFGAAWGRWSLGAFVGGSARDFPVSRYQAITAGVSFRLPLMAGIVCCAFISRGKSGSGGSSPSSSPSLVHTPHRRHETAPATPVKPPPSPPPEPQRIETPKRDELKP